LCFKFSKPGSSARVVCPALGHKAVEGRRAVWRHGEPLTVLNPPNYIIVLHSLEGLYPMHEDLPHTHTWGTHTKKHFLCVSKQKKKCYKRKQTFPPAPAHKALILRGKKGGLIRRVTEIKDKSLLSELLCSGILHVRSSQSTWLESYSQTMRFLLKHIARESIFTYRLTAARRDV